MVDTRTLDLLQPAHLLQGTLEIQVGSVPNLSPISLDNGLMEVKIIFCCVVITVNLLLENMLACVTFSLYRMPILNIMLACV